MTTERTFDSIAQKLVADEKLLYGDDNSRFFWFELRRRAQATYFDFFLPGRNP